MLSVSKACQRAASKPSRSKYRNNDVRARYYCDPSKAIVAISKSNIMQQQYIVSKYKINVLSYISSVNYCKSNVCIYSRIG